MARTVRPIALIITPLPPYLSSPPSAPISTHSLGSRRYGQLVAVYILCINGCSRGLFCDEPNSWGPQWVSPATFVSVPAPPLSLGTKPMHSRSIYV